jgi:hypothetical protein
MRGDPSTPSTAMKLVLQLALAAALGAPLPGWAALYKCTVEAQTVYQERPCGREQGTQTVVLPGATARAHPAAPAPVRVAVPALPSASAPAPSRAPLSDAEREDAARRAFAALARGDIDAYHAMLCPQAQAKYEAAGGKRLFREFSRAILRDRDELTNVISHQGTSIYFDATRVADPATGRREPVGLVYTTEVRQDKNGTACLSGLAVTTRKSAQR